MTHKLENNYIAEVLLWEWEFWAPRQAPQPEGLALGGGACRARGFEGQQGLNAGALKASGKQRLYSRMVHIRFHVHWDPGQSSNSTGGWFRPTCGSWGGRESAATRMDLEVIIQSKVTQRKTNIMWYHLYVESKKKKKMIQMNLFINRNRLTAHKNKFIFTKGERYQRGVN